MSSQSSKMIGLLSLSFMVVLVVCLYTPPAHGLKECGTKLTELLILVCRNGFGTRAKKSFDALDYDGDSEGSEDTALALEGWPFLTGIESNSLTKTRRRRLGIAHECCDKACSMAELMTFCLPIAAQ